MEMGTGRQFFGVLHIPYFLRRIYGAAWCEGVMAYQGAAKSEVFLLAGVTYQVVEQ
jgi:hypothetical protein